MTTMGQSRREDEERGHWVLRRKFVNCKNKKGTDNFETLFFQERTTESLSLPSLAPPLFLGLQVRSDGPGAKRTTSRFQLLPEEKSFPPRAGEEAPFPSERRMAPPRPVRGKQQRKQPERKFRRWIFGSTLLSERNVLCEKQQDMKNCTPGLCC